MLHYQPGAPGDWLIAVAAGGVFAVRASAPGESSLESDALLTALAADGGARAALEIVTANGLSATPHFALARRTSTGALRCILRGPARLTVRRADSEVRISGEGVDTWLEQSFDDAVSFTLELGGVAAPASASAPLAIETGTAWASAVFSPASDEPRESSPATRQSRATSAPDLSTRAVETTIADVTVAGAPETAEDETVGTIAGSYDHLFGATVARSVESAAVRPQEPEELAAEVPGDHDGLTVMSGDLQKLRSRRSKERPPTTVAEPPPSFRIELANGTVEPLDAPILVGRAPSVTKASGTQVPRLVTVDSVEQDISRNHVRFAVEGDSVVVTDLHSRNGTSVILPGKPPLKLRQGEPTTVIADTVVDLGNGVTMTVRQGAAPRGR